MSRQRTFSIIKPNAVAKSAIGAILTRFEQAKFKIVAIKMLHMNRAQAEGFYAEHQGKPFFEPLINFMISGPIVALVLEGENAVEGYRQLMGATDPAKAAVGTIRADFADSLRENAVHGSDSIESAAREIAYFFTESELTEN